MAELVVGGLTALVCCPAVFAVPAQDDDGSIWGVVTDELGGLLPGVTVTARSAATGIARSGATGDVGSYEVACGRLRGELLQLVGPHRRVPRPPLPAFARPEDLCRLHPRRRSAVVRRAYRKPLGDPSHSVRSAD